MKRYRTTKARPYEQPRRRARPIAVAKTARGVLAPVEWPAGPTAPGCNSVEAQAAWLGDTRLQLAQRQALAAQIGRIQGNRHLQRVVASIEPTAPAMGQVSEDAAHSQTLRSSSLAEVERQENDATSDPRVQFAFAGTVVEQSAQDGMIAIERKGQGAKGRASIGFHPGLTLRKSASLFTAPFLKTQTTSVKRGTRWQHFARVLPTTSADVVHKAYYPGKGDHKDPRVKDVRIGGITYKYYYRIPQKISNLIKAGEQEHLNDLLWAYTISYKHIENTINALAKAGKPYTPRQDCNTLLKGAKRGHIFGPVNNPNDAYYVAEAALSRKLPKQLSNRLRWTIALQALLDLTSVRDTKGWHTLNVLAPKKERKRGSKVGKLVRLVEPEAGKTSIGKMSSKQLVSLDKITK